MNNAKFLIFVCRLEGEKIMNKLDILFVKPGSQRQIYGELSAYNLTGIEPPLWAAILAGYMRGLGYGVGVLDAELKSLDYEETAKQIGKADPSLAAIMVSGTNPSASTMNMTGAGEIASFVRKLYPNIKILLGGLHPSALPERTLAEEDVDFVCQGEGFYTLPKLIDAIKESANSFPIEGLFYKKEGEMLSNPSPPLLKDLDQLPMPAWDLLPISQYRAHNWHCFEHIEDRAPYAVLYTSLGCPFNCSFCCINALFGKRTIRYRSEDKVLEEIDFLVGRYGIRNIKIADEMFGLDEDRVVSLCEKIAVREYGLNMWAYARVNTVSQRMLDKMKEAGINWIAYGFESGSKRVIQDVSKGYNIDRVAEVARMTRDRGIYICANFIFGLPEDDYDTMQETLVQMQDINAEWANIYCTMAYPGSRLYERALESNLPLPAKWQEYSQYAYESLPLPSRYLSPGEILCFRDYAFHAYFESPRYLAMIKNRFGLSTVKHIREMTKNRLKRKHQQFDF